MKPVLTLLVVASGDKARFFENPGPGRGLIEIENEARSLLAEDRATPTDREGRVASGGGSHHGLEPRTSLDEKLRDGFARDIVEAIAARALVAPFDRLGIAAPAHMLGALRAALTPALQKRLAFDLARDLVAETVADMPAHFGGVATF